jgi:hypothetical protein
VQHHFPKSTVEASMWCQKCHRDTVWTIAGGRPMHCTVCQAKPPDPPPPRRRKKAEPEPMFDFTEDPKNG